MRRSHSRKPKAKAKKKVACLRKVSSTARAYRPSVSADALEDGLLAADARRALADPENRERIPWEQLKAELGL